MSPEIIFDPYTKLYSEASGLAKSSHVRDLMSIAGRSDIISFAGGLPFIGGLSPEEISEVMGDLLSEGYTEAFQYGETGGRDRLKEALASVMAREGLRADPEHIQITTGSQQALDLLSRVFIDRGDPIVIEGPSYLGALGAFCAAGARTTTIPLDGDGMRIDLLEEHLEGAGAALPKFIYVVPNFHNPAGVTMSAQRRQRLFELAEKYDILLVEDNPYGLLRFEGEPVSPIATMGKERVLYLGTLSKIVSPGIRVGWVFGPTPIVEKFETLKQSADLCSSTLNQMFAEAFIEKGFVWKNIERLRPIYLSRLNAMLAALEKRFPPEARWTHPQGGLFIWVEFPEYLDTEKMLPLAIQQKVAFVPGVAFYPDGSGKNKLRLNFSFANEEQIAEGIARLGKVIGKEMRMYRALGLDR